MAVALGAMCITNFVLDAPFTIFLTNTLHDIFKSHKNNKEAKVAQQCQQTQQVETGGVKDE